MHCANNTVIMQTEKLGQIETLEEELHSSKVKLQELKGRLVEQDHVITNLVRDNLGHLQDNMCLTTYINSLSEQIAQLETQLGQVGSVLMGMIEGAIKRERLSSLEAGTLDASGNNQDNQGGDAGSGGYWCISGREYEGGEPNTVGGWSDCRDGEGGNGGWCWGVVQRESRGCPGELEWAQLRCVGQSGLSGDGSPDNYWWPNLA